MSSTHAQVGDLVLLVGEDDKRFYVRLTPGASLHTHHGLVKHDQIAGAPFGGTVRTHTGHAYQLLQVSLFQQVMRIKRATAIIYPKDIGYILLKINAVNGAHIVEAGTGSGALTLALARAVAPEGHVFTYEERSDMQSLARKNLDAMGALANVTMTLRNIADGFDQTDVDALFLDVREPHWYLAQARAALKGGGFFGAIVPTANQVSNLLTGLQQGGWIQIEVEELMLRPYKTVPERLRPDDRMVAHTGYLIFARKVDNNMPPPSAPVEEPSHEPVE
ncbi:MAG: tRNA (adenine-N1)-methyltransferase [Chloroflexi bacterium]|nr:tRNA (adenine-N1)-methyltransferase [Chloroflexota bacterium]